MWQLNLITAAGTESLPATITTGMTAFTTAAATLVETIHPCRATTFSTARTRSVLPSGMTGLAIKSVLHRGQNGLAAETWTWGMARLLATVSALSFGSRLIQSEARHNRVIPPWHRTLRLTPGAVPPRKVARRSHCRWVLMRSLPLALTWSLRPATVARVARP